MGGGVGAWGARGYQRLPPPPANQPACEGAAFGRWGGEGSGEPGPALPSSPTRSWLALASRPAGARPRAKPTTLATPREDGRRLMLGCPAGQEKAERNGRGGGGAGRRPSPGRPFRLRLGAQKQRAEGRRPLGRPVGEAERGGGRSTSPRPGAPLPARLAFPSQVQAPQRRAATLRRRGENCLTPHKPPPPRHRPHQWLTSAAATVLVWLRIAALQTGGGGSRHSRGSEARRRRWGRSSLLFFSDGRPWTWSPTRPSQSGLAGRTAG